MQSLITAYIIASTLIQAVIARTSNHPSSPKIIIQLVIDDLGHADTTLQTDVISPDIPTPNLKKLTSQGVLLSNMHVQPVCSPTRSALMTGRFPFRDGMQHENTIAPGSLAAIPRTTLTVPEMLKSSTKRSPNSANSAKSTTATTWSTYAVGKWHLGYSSFSHTPVGRGFDNFVGYFQGQVDYYNKTIANGFDFWKDQKEFRAGRFIKKLFFKSGLFPILFHFCTYL